MRSRKVERGGKKGSDGSRARQACMQCAGEIAKKPGAAWEGSGSKKHAKHGKQEVLFQSSSPLPIRKE